MGAEHLSSHLPRISRTVAGLSACLLAGSALLGAVTVDIDALRHDAAAPIIIELPAGTYHVIPIGREDGGQYDAWLASVTNPASWVHAYGIGSSQFEPLRLWDGELHATPGEALGSAKSAVFTLATAGTVRFYHLDDAQGDNRGGISLLVLPDGPRFQRGDSNQDGRVEMSDALRTLGCLFTDAECKIPCLDAADSNDDGSIDISDPVLLLVYLFVGGSAPSPPFGACGLDRTDDLLPVCSDPAC